MNGLANVLKEVLKQKKQGTYKKAEKILDDRKKQLKEQQEYKKLIAQKENLQKQQTKVEEDISKIEKKHGVTSSWSIRDELDRQLEDKFLKARIDAQLAEGRDEAMKAINEFEKFEAVV